MKFFSYLAKSYHRNLLEKLLIKNKHLILGKILDIGSKGRRYDYLFDGEIIAADIIPVPELNIIKADLTNMHFESNSFDSIVCLEVFQYLEPENFKKGFEEIYRVLKKNGKALISMPFYCWEHRDNMRATFNFISNYLKQLKNLDSKIIKLGNRYTSIYDSVKFGNNITLLPKFRNLRGKFILFLLYLIIKGFSLENKQDSFYSGYFIIFSKK